MEEQPLNGAETATESVIDRVELLVDHGIPLVLRASAGGRVVRHYVYVDNVGVIGVGLRVVADTMNALISAFTARGLPTHELQVTDHELEALGVILDPCRRHTRIAAKRFWRVRQGITGLLRRRAVSGRLLEVVLGHCVKLQGEVRSDDVEVITVGLSIP